MRAFKAGRLAFVAFGALMALSSGCTEKTMQIPANVDYLLKETENLNRRVAQLETSTKALASSAKDASTLAIEVKSVRADANSAAEKLRQEFSELRGAIEEGAHAQGETVASIDGVKVSVSTLADKVTALERALKDSEKRLSGEIARLEASVAALQASEPNAKRIDPEALYHQGYEETVNEKNYAKGTETLNRFLAEFPSHKLAGNAQYWLGEISYANGDWEKSVVEFNKVVEKYPGNDKVSAALLKEGFAFEKLGALKEARALFKRLIETHPKSPEAALAKKKLAEMK